MYKMTHELLKTYINGREMEDIYSKKEAKKWRIIKKLEKYIISHIHVPQTLLHPFVYQSIIIYHLLFMATLLEGL